MNEGMIFGHLQGDDEPENLGLLALNDLWEYQKIQCRRQTVVECGQVLSQNLGHGICVYHVYVEDYR